MFAFIPTMNGMLTLAESGFNCLGYLPKNHFPKLHIWSIRWRRHCGQGQLITGIAIAALGCFCHYAFPSLALQTYLSLPLKMVSFGALYANHGFFNILRSYVEMPNIPGLTLVYDFYGRKALPPLNPNWDLLNTLFQKLKDIFDRFMAISVFPPEFIYRS